MDIQDSSRASVICELCTEEVKDYITNPCGHQFCWDCITKYRTESSSPEKSCSSCYLNKPLQLILADCSGQLHLKESVVKRCFSECEDLPVYVISVIGERRSGKSFLMNYLIRVLRNMELKKKYHFGGENESLNPGFPWRPGTDKVTEGIWIWGRPFILKCNEGKVAVYLLDTEGTNNTSGHETVSMKLSVLTTMISSHLVYNVNANVNKTDIEYLEIYCDPMDVQFHVFSELKYFDVLIRDWPHAEDCNEEFAKSYIAGQIQNLQKMDMNNVLNMVENRTVRCFLMPHPGIVIAEGDNGNLRDMDEDFQNNLKVYLLDVFERAQNSSSFLTCRKMAEKLPIYVDYVQNGHNFSTSLELCNQIKTQAEKKTEEEMERLVNEFCCFLEEQAWWKLPNQMSITVSKKAKEVMKTFYDLLILTSPGHEHKLMNKLHDKLKEEGDNYCEKQKANLKNIGLKAAVHVGLTAASTAVVPLLLPAAAPVAAGGILARVGGWFVSTPAATVSVSRVAIGTAVAGVSMAQMGAAYVMKKFW